MCETKTGGAAMWHRHLGLAVTYIHGWLHLYAEVEWVQGGSVVWVVFGACYVPHQTFHFDAIKLLKLSWPLCMCFHYLNIKINYSYKFNSWYHVVPSSQSHHRHSYLALPIQFKHSRRAEIGLCMDETCAFEQGKTKDGTSEYTSQPCTAIMAQTLKA